ncbi:hypothetical protein BXU10_21240 [Flavobacterium sp. LM4]|nr:hypothetical protein BXU10_21240 [Flavobacterium sp. LM4]
MKNSITVLMLLLMISCTQNDDKQLNDDIYDGRGGISCEVNGVVLKPSTAILYNNKGFDFGKDINNIPTLSVSFTNNSGYDFKSIRLVALDASYESDLVGKVFSLKNETNQESYANYEFYNNGVPNKYKTDDINNGELKILFYDKQKNILGGTFWFDAINSKGENVKVKNGKFDLKR